MRKLGLGLSGMTSRLDAASDENYRSSSLVRLVVAIYKTLFRV